MGTVMTDRLTEIRERFDRVVLDLLGPIRMQKRVDSDALATMLGILSDLAEVMQDEDQVPRKLVGDLWYVFTAMLAEADHAKDPPQILAAAWEIQEQLQQIFGPK